MSRIAGLGITGNECFSDFESTLTARSQLLRRVIERYKAKVRQMRSARQSRTSNELREAWWRYIRGRWSYFRLTEERRPICRLDGWIRRHIRSCFWLRWHSVAGRLRHLRELDLSGRLLKVAHCSRGAWHLAAIGSLQTALPKTVLRDGVFWCHRILRDNRRVEPPDTENRTSGGVGGRRGENPRCPTRLVLWLIASGALRCGRRSRASAAWGTQCCTGEQGSGRAVTRVALASFGQRFNGLPLRGRLGRRWCESRDAR